MFLANVANAPGRLSPIVLKRIVPQKYIHIITEVEITMIHDFDMADIKVISPF